MVLTMEEVKTSETSVNLYEITRYNIPKDSRLHTRRRENLKSNLNELDHDKGRDHLGDQDVDGSTIH
jgi:hypothetical protein